MEVVSTMHVISFLQVDTNRRAENVTVTVTRKDAQNLVSFDWLKNH